MLFMTTTARPLVQKNCVLFFVCFLWQLYLSPRSGTILSVSVLKTWFIVLLKGFWGKFVTISSNKNQLLEYRNNKYHEIIKTLTSPTSDHSFSQRTICLEEINCKSIKKHCHNRLKFNNYFSKRYRKT